MEISFMKMLFFHSFKHCYCSINVTPVTMEWPCGEFVKVQVCCQQCHHRYFITHRSRLNTGRTFPVAIMEAMLRFMQHKGKRKTRFHSLYINWFHLQIRISLFRTATLNETPSSSSAESGFFRFSDKCEMCLKVLGGNNYFFMPFTSEKWLIISRILAIFLHFCEILNICNKNEIYCF